MKTATFSATILSGHKEDAVEVPFDPAQRWNSEPASIRAGRRGHPVHAEIGGHGFDTHIVARSKKFWLLLPREAEAAAGISAGSRIEVTVKPAATD